MTEMDMKQHISEDNKIYLHSFLALILILLGLFCVKTIQNPDFFWHLKVGEDIIRNMAVPVYDTYSYHEGLRFLAHEWLFDVIIYGVYSTLGIYGIFFMLQVAGIATAYMIYKNVRLLVGEITFSIFMCFIISVLFIPIFLVPRPQMLSSFFSLIALYLLESWFGIERNGSAGKSIWIKRYSALVVLSILWINIHGGSYPIFIILLSGYGLEILIDYLKRRDGKTLKRLLRLISVGVAAVLSFCINPYGVKMIAFPFMLTSETTTYFIREWKSPEFYGAVGVFRYVIMALPIISLISYKKEIRLKTLWYVAVFTFMALSSGRHIGLLILFNYLAVTPMLHVVLSETWSNITSFLGGMTKKPIIPFLIMAILVTVLTGKIWSDLIPYQGAEYPVEDTGYPVEALAYINETGLDTDNNVLLNNYGWGGYMLYNGHKVFIDGRADVYQGFINPQSQVMKDYVDIVELVRVEEILDKYKCKYVLHIKNGALSTYLQMHPDWKVLFESDAENSILLMKNGG